MTYIRIPTVKEACELDPKALNFAMSDQVEHLSDLLKEAEGAADEFFAKNHVTQGMERLLREGLLRLSGKSTQAVFELRQAMGGGKTHSMLALGMMARNPHLYDRVPSKITQGIPETKATVVAINGRTISPDHFLWGDIAKQLGKFDDFSNFWRNGPDAPREDDWINLIGDKPTLILLDELPPYLDYAVTRSVGGGTLAQVTTYALSNLLSAVMKLPRAAIVVSNLTGSYQSATQALANEVAKVLKNIAEETKRQARPITPVDLNTNEIYEILRKRMFTKLPDEAEITKVAEAYGEAINLAVRAKTIARSPEQIADEVMGSYPFHPSVKNIIALFKENENYRQTRGLMQFVSKMLKSVWEGNQAHDVYLIGCQHLDLTISDVREEVNRIGEIEAALTTDVIAADGSAHAQVIDADKGNDAATQVAKLILTASLSQSVESVKGLTKATAIEYLVVPDRSASEFDEAFNDLQSACWYLHRKENDVWYFSKIENLRKRIQNRAQSAPVGKIEEEMRRRLGNAFEARSKQAYQAVHALPRVDDIKIESIGRHCLVMSPDSRTPPEDAHLFLNSQTYKNSFCVVTGDGSSMGNLEDKTRMIWAIQKVKVELGDKPTYTAELDELAETAEFEFGSALTALFNRVYFPMPTPDKKGARLAHTPLKLSVEKKEVKGAVVHEVNGEAAVEEALAAIGAKKLIVDVETEADSLILRAEDMLWSETQSRIPWKDVVSRAQSNVRWSWLPPKGLETLREHAVATGRWSYDGDGYVDKAPPKPRTSANVVERSRDDETGEVELEVFALNAGKKGVIFVSKTGDFDQDGAALEKNPFSTNETKLWFLVKDPDGKHEQGEAVVWTNTIGLTHQPQFLPGKRLVELTAVPRGEIRWNTDGTDPKQGTVYTGPIELTGKAEVMIWACAMDKGVFVEKEFKIPGTAEDQTIDKTKKATLKREIVAGGTADVFKAIQAAESNNASLKKAKLTVGDGSKNISLRIGDAIEVAPTHFRELIKACRLALGDAEAPVLASFPQMTFATGFDLEQFAQTLGEDVRVTDVEQ
jgi:hypothetical protein